MRAGSAAAGLADLAAADWSGTGGLVQAVCCICPLDWLAFLFVLSAPHVPWPWPAWWSHLPACLSCCRGKIGHAFTAHPKLDPETGELFYFGYSVGKAPHCETRLPACLPVCLHTTPALPAGASGQQ